jgi:hypothetical protein
MKNEECKMKNEFGNQGNWETGAAGRLGRREDWAAG